MASPFASATWRRRLSAGVAWLRRRAVRVLAVAKFGKAALLAAIGFGAFRLINRDLEEIARHWAYLFRIDPENRVLDVLLVKLSAVNPVKLRHLGWWSLVFSADQVVEGIGLWFNQAWAKYLMLVATSAFLLDRCYQLGRRFTWGQVPFFIGTVVLLLVIIWILLQDRAREAGHGRPASPSTQK